MQMPSSTIFLDIPMTKPSPVLSAHQQKAQQRQTLRGMRNLDNATRQLSGQHAAKVSGPVTMLLQDAVTLSKANHQFLAASQLINPDSKGLLRKTAHGTLQCLKQMVKAR
jgi:hypothetical protein